MTIVPGTRGRVIRPMRYAGCEAVSVTGRLDQLRGHLKGNDDVLTVRLTRSYSNGRLEAQVGRTLRIPLTNFLPE